MTVSCILEINDSWQDWAHPAKLLNLCSAPLQTRFFTHLISAGFWGMPGSLQVPTGMDPAPSSSCLQQGPESPGGALRKRDFETKKLQNSGKNSDAPWKVHQEMFADEQSPMETRPQNSNFKIFSILLSQCPQPLRCCYSLRAALRTENAALLFLSPLLRKNYI